jgi:hypothetical protein
MSGARRVSQAVVAVAILLAGTVLILKWRSSATFFDPPVLLSHFPVEDAAVFSADVAKLRAAGLLPPASQTPEPEYKQFVDDTGFDYKRDLDLVAASFSNSGTYFIARGRFDFQKLEAYAKRQGGNCYQRLCRMQGSRPDRRISFLPLRGDTLALAVSTDDLAAAKLESTGPKVTAKLPTDPVWLSVPGTFLRSRDLLPLSVRVTLSGITTAERVVFTLNQSGQGIELRMSATCQSPDEARVLSSQLRSSTSQLKEALAKSTTPPEELVRAVANGSFDQKEKLVAGRWPLPQSLLKSLTTGI